MSLSSKETRSRNKRAFIILGILILLLLLFELLFVGNIRYYGKWISCGNQPYSAYSGGYLNSSPAYYELPSKYPIARDDVKENFCTAEEADAAGYLTK